MSPSLTPTVSAYGPGKRHGHLLPSLTPELYPRSGMGFAPIYVLRCLILILTFAIWLPIEAVAQAPAPTTSRPDNGWRWTTSATGFFGLNYQQRKFTDFRKWESQNWLMGVGERKVSRGVLMVTSMLSLEPFTMQKLGSPQVFQGGETYRGAPLIDYQHPHDLLMEFSGDYRQPVGPASLHFSAALVVPAAYGPPVFMHRPSAVDNPQVPLSHHYMDSTHMSDGVLRTGVDVGQLSVDASWFRGREPDDNHTDIDVGALDSWSVRGMWTRGSWSVQLSGAHLRKPEVLEPFDHTKLSASISHAWSGAGPSVDTMIAWGENREIHGNLDAYLAETHAQLTMRDAIYGRAELAAKDQLDKGGFHPIGFLHPHRISRVAAFTAGYVRDVAATPHGRVGIGGDVASYWIAPNLRDSYGRPFSYHVFVRLRSTPGAASAHAHTH